MWRRWEKRWTSLPVCKPDALAAVAYLLRRCRQRNSRSQGGELIVLSCLSTYSWACCARPFTISVHHHAASSARTIARAVDLIALDNAPLSARPPVLPELVIRILRVLLWMLFPVAIGKINAVSGSEILFFQRGEEAIGDVLFRPEAVPPNQKRNHHDHSDDRGDPDPPPACARAVVFLCIQESHTSLA